MEGSTWPQPAKILLIQSDSTILQSKEEHNTFEIKVTQSVVCASP